MTPWTCTACQEPQVSWAPIPIDRLCHTCRDNAANLAQAEKTAGIPARYLPFTRHTWTHHFNRPWPAEVDHWTGHPHWLTLWGPTGTGKTGLATVLLAEHLRGAAPSSSPLPAGARAGGIAARAEGAPPAGTLHPEGAFPFYSPLPAGARAGANGRGAGGEGASPAGSLQPEGAVFPPLPGAGRAMGEGGQGGEAFLAGRAARTAHWISALALAERLRREINTDEDVLAPLLVTGLLLIDEPLAVDATPWFFDRLGLLCRTRDEADLPTIVTLQQDPSTLLDKNPPAPPALISRWLSGLLLFIDGEDVRLRVKA